MPSPSMTYIKEIRSYLIQWYYFENYESPETVQFECSLCIDLDGCDILLQNKQYMN